MRYRFVFAAGVGVGFVLGARAGRERYDQLRRLTRRVADNPAVQQAAGAVQARAADAARTVRNRVTEQVPRMAGSARSRIGGTLHDRVPGMHGRGAPHADADGHQRYTSSPGTHPGHPEPR